MSSTPTAAEIAAIDREQVRLIRSYLKSYAREQREFGRSRSGPACSIHQSITYAELQRRNAEAA